MKGKQFRYIVRFYAHEFSWILNLFAVSLSGDRICFS